MKHKILLYIGFCLVVVCFTQMAYSQKPGSYGDRISQAKATAQPFNEVSGLLTVNKSVRRNLRTKMNNARYFNFNQKVSKQLINDAPAYISLEIPAATASAAMVLALKKVSDTFLDYQVTTSKGVTYMRGANASQIHYRGVVQGKEGSSLVALSVFENEAMGFVSIEGRKTLSLGKLKEEGFHALYSDDDLGIKSTDTGCLTSSDEQNVILDEIYAKLDKNQMARTTATTKCLKVYFETDYGMYQNLGNSVTNVENFVTGLFNEVATLYDNDGINTEISQIFVWSTPDSYSSSISTGLNDFVAARATFNGDVAQLLTYKSGDNDPNNLSNAGGRANGIGGLCVTGNTSLSPHAHTVLFPPNPVVTVPTFSRQVKVVTHEMGHNLGSRHTHACVWNGNNTAIDGCSGFTEGSCATPGNPAGGGTIMSYCDRTSVGINFNLGFGPQPTTVIQNMINSAACVDACASCAPDLIITASVTSGQTSNKEASNSITANNTIFNGGTANYQAGNFILLTSGFHSQTGSTTSLVIAPCSSDVVDIAPSTNQTAENQSSTSNFTSDVTHNDVRLFPNPTRGQFTIQVPAGGQKSLGGQTVEVYTLMGTSVLKKEVVPGEKVSVDLNNHPKGIYLVKYMSNRRITIKKVVYK